jgi:DNA-binding response OmpR family regulator
MKNLTDKIRITIVEDDTAIRELYKYKFELENFAVSVAGDGQEGLTVIERQRPELILLDIRMPVMNGDEMLRRLRAQDWGARIRVIVLTNISRSEAPSNLQFLHVDRYILKAHFTPQQVVDVAREVLS